jgi:cytochrome c oxidase subunit II
MLSGETMLAAEGGPWAVDRAFLLVGGVCVALFAVVAVTMTLFAVRYRRGRRRTAAQIHGHLALETAWVVVPSAIAFWMFFVGLAGFRELRTVPPGALTVQVTGRQWAWSFHYPDSGVDSDRLYAPAGRPVRLELTSVDVIHGLFIPDFRRKEDALPGRTTYMWFEAAREGRHNVFCTQFCGKGHSEMISELVVLSPQGFDEWVAGRVARRHRPVDAAGTLDPASPAVREFDGAGIYRSYCVSCHGKAGDGSGMESARDFRSSQGWKRSPRVVDIYRTLDEGVPGTNMRPFPNLAPWERIAVAWHARSFNQDAPPADTEADAVKLIKDYALDKPPPSTVTMPVEKAMKALVEEARRANEKR